MLGGPTIIVEDFDLGTDVLAIDAYSASRGAVDLDAIDIVEAQDGSGTEVVLTYDDGNDGSRLTAVIALPGVTGLKMNDIVLIDPDA